MDSHPGLSDPELSVFLCYCDVVCFLKLNHLLILRMFRKYLKVATFMRKEVIKIVINSNCENSSNEPEGWRSKPYLDIKGRISALTRVREGTSTPTDSSGKREHMSSPVTAAGVPRQECQGRGQPGALSLADCARVCESMQGTSLVQC